MLQQDNINILTFHTLRWIYGNKRENKMLEAKSPAHLRQMISFWANGKETPSSSFIKGQNMIDFNALFEFVCDRRGWMYPMKDFALRLVNYLKAESEARRKSVG